MRTAKIRRQIPVMTLGANRALGGFTMIEVLVTVLVLSIGLLGLAGLQATSLRNNHSAYLRSQATVLAYDIADRMRANRSSAGAGNYVIGLGDDAPSGTAIAATDLSDWKAALAQLLPAGDGAIAIAADDTVTITVQWDDSRGQEAAKQFVVKTRL